MGKCQWDKWRGVDEFKERMDRLLEEALRDMARDLPGGQGFVWVPLADVFETPGALVARVELPGVAAADLVVEAADGELIVRGERPLDAEAQDAAYHLMERSHGAFARRFSLPPDADCAGISAVLLAGVLTVTVPRRARTAPGARRISVG